MYWSEIPLWISQSESHKDGALQRIQIISVRSVTKILG
jgi:hypothetical protein